MKQLTLVASLLFALAILVQLTSDAAADTPGWRRAKNTADDVIYAGKDRTLYCGCVYTSHGSNDGSGSVNHQACGYQPPPKHANRAGRVEWEHIVPASLVPARHFDCWVLGNREKCEREDPRAQAMIFDLHNLAPSIGQVNALRFNDRYVENLPDETSDFGNCPIEDKKGAFEPPDCLKGDVARIWLYMSLRHGVVIPPDERDMFSSGQRRILYHRGKANERNASSITRSFRTHSYMTRTRIPQVLVPGSSLGPG
jgi:deoxyribonuclease-1